MRTDRRLIYLSACWSGFFVMGVELLAGRLLAPYFGSSVFVWGGIIFVFMACLSVGYLLGGRLSTRNPTMGGLGILVLLEACFALPIILVGDPVLDRLSLLVPDPRYGSLLGSLALFGVPTVISGMISPYCVRLLIGDVRYSGASAGSLYFSSTIGSAAGTIMTSFYFVLYLELFRIIELMVCVSTVVGCAVLLREQLVWLQGKR